MILNRNRMADLIHFHFLGMTRDHEINCNECLDKMGEFAEHELAGKRFPSVLEEVQHHLTLCAQCAEEYEALLVALKKTDVHGNFQE
jgi:hypothetical protein